MLATYISNLFITILLTNSLLYYRWLDIYSIATCLVPHIGLYDLVSIVPD